MQLALLISNRPLLSSLKYVHIENPKPMIDEMVLFEKLVFLPHEKVPKLTV